MPTKKTAKKAAVKKGNVKKIITSPKKKAASKSTPKEQTVSVIKKKKATTTPKEKKIPAIEQVVNDTLKISFYVKFRTVFGQNLFILGNHPLLGNGKVEKSLPLKYLDEETWVIELEWDKSSLPDQEIIYNYVLKNPDGSIIYDWGLDKKINPSTFVSDKVTILDSWNHAGYFENIFYTEPFKEYFLKDQHTEVKTTVPRLATHLFKVKAPLLAKGKTICLIGSSIKLGKWDTTKTILLKKELNGDYYTAQLNLGKLTSPVAYKYGVYDVDTKVFEQYEAGDNRVLNKSQEGTFTIVNDGFVQLPANTWKGAGVALPVFSLRSENSFGVGEFTDINLLVEWSKNAGLKLIQILPVNDTIATYTWTDSYPYAAISTFALHPIYLNLSKVVDEENKHLIDELEGLRKRLNALDTMDYETVISTKINFIKQVFPLQKAETFKSSSYKEYFKQNKHWLVPYAAFCYLRDQYGTAHFNEWPAFRQYNTKDITSLTATKSEAYDEISLHYFIQYHLHKQLKSATDYAHESGIIIKGDLPIGVYRYGVDAWQHPELYHIDMQAGAPPDDFAIKGQNWNFPTYNWQRMKEDGYAWWKYRFEQMSYYFDAFRIDHILGFFRMWSIPLHSVEGVMGYFVPAIPVFIEEFEERGIAFDYDRYVQPYITDDVLNEVFGEKAEGVKEQFLIRKEESFYSLKPGFATQRQVEKYFNAIEKNNDNLQLKQGLFDLISNVLLFEVENSNRKQFHFRFDMDKTTSFQHLDAHAQYWLKELYENYFFQRQDAFWKKEAMEKLPAIRRVTNMLVFGEDLGLVPSCVRHVMEQIGVLSLEIQRMPKSPERQFFHPNDAPYLSVVTPSTHDMSTIRGWWEEDKDKIQQFYNYELGEWGSAPYFCEPWIEKIIITQHLHSPAMWSIFQLQDLMGIDEKLRRENPNEERINVPANPQHYWNYRIHLPLEKLLQSTTLTDELHTLVKESGR